MKHNSEVNLSTNVHISKKKDMLIPTLLSIMCKLSPKLTGKFIKHFFFNTRKYKPSAEELSTLHNAIPFNIKVHGKNLKGWKWGDGPGILLMHGWNGRGIQFHKFVDPLLKEGYSPILIDGPAHGDSEGRRTSYFEFSDVVRYIMKPAHKFNIQGIIGHSFGASAAINCISKDKYPVKLVLIAPALYLRDTLHKAFSSHGIPVSMFSDIIEEYENYYGYNLQKDDPINLIGDLNTVILLIHDKNDKAIPYEHSEIASGINSNIELVQTVGEGHSRILKSDQVVQYCIAFITSKKIKLQEISA